MPRLAWSRRVAAAAAALVVFFASASAFATVVVPLTRSSMVTRADMIVRATVLRADSRWNEDHSQIITLTQLRVTRWIKGNPASSSSSVLVLRQLGGTVGNLRSEIAGDPQLRATQDVVLLLRRGEGVVYLVAMAQSAYFVERSPAGQALVRRDLEGLTFAVRDAGQLRLVEPDTEIGEPLDRFLAELSALVGGAR